MPPLVDQLGEHVTNSELGQAFNKYIAQPCDLEVYRYGNMAEQSKYQWTGHPDSLAGLLNQAFFLPLIDMQKLIQRFSGCWLKTGAFGIGDRNQC